MDTARSAPVAVAKATPLRDPLAEQRVRLRRVGAADRTHRVTDHGPCCCTVRRTLYDEIVRALAAGMSYRQIAREVGLNTMSVHRIRKGEQ